MRGASIWKICLHSRGFILFKTVLQNISGRKPALGNSPIKLVNIHLAFAHLELRMICPRWRMIQNVILGSPFTGAVGSPSRSRRLICFQNGNMTSWQNHVCHEIRSHYKCQLFDFIFRIRYCPINIHWYGCWFMRLALVSFLDVLFVAECGLKCELSEI